MIGKKKKDWALTVWLSWLGIIHEAKGRQFSSWSGHMPGLWVQSPVGAGTRGNPSMFLSHIDASFPLFLPPFPSL